MNGVRLWQQLGPMASKAFAAVLYQNRNKGLSERWNWIQATHKVALPPLLGSQVPRMLPRTDTLDTNLALKGREPPSVANRAPVAIPASPATRTVPSSGRSVHPVENKDPSQSSSGNGGTRPFQKQPPPISQKGRSSDGPSKAPQFSRPYPPLLVANGTIGIGKIGNLNFWALSDHALLCVHFWKSPLGFVYWFAGYSNTAQRVKC